MPDQDPVSGIRGSLDRLAENEIKLSAVKEGAAVTTELSAHHRITPTLTFKAYVQALFNGTKAQPKVGAELTWRPGQK